MLGLQTVLLEKPAEGIARIVLNRPEARNAQNYQLIYDLVAAFNHVGQDNQIKVIILAGAGPHFSSGHDLRELRTLDEDRPYDRFSPISGWGGFDEPGAAGLFAREQEIYMEAVKRWRNLPKPTIAQVQGKCIAGGLMLAWACDLIVASEDAEFSDPVVQWGVCGVERPGGSRIRDGEPSCRAPRPGRFHPRPRKKDRIEANVWTAHDKGSCEQDHGYHGTDQRHRQRLWPPSRLSRLFARVRNECSKASGQRARRTENGLIISSFFSLKVTQRFEFAIRKKNNNRVRDGKRVTWRFNFAYTPSSLRRASAGASRKVVFLVRGAGSGVNRDNPA